MAPISRHFLPVLQPEPPAWLTTGLMKGSRRPFAAYLLSGTTDCSVASPPPSRPTSAPLLATAGCAGSTTAGFGGALCFATDPETCFPALVCLTVTGAAIFSGVTGAALWCTDKASFDAAVARLLTAFIVLRVFWMTLEL